MSISRNAAILIRDILKVAEELTETSLDGMSKHVAVRNVNKILSRYTKGFFADQNWRPIDDVFHALTAAQIDWVLVGTQYRNDSRGVPNSKEWKFEIRFIRESGREAKLYGTMIASGAGSVADPLEKYDVVAYVS